MNREQADEVLADFAALTDPRAETALEAVKAALMLEDVFGIRLSDSDIDPTVLSDPVAVSGLLDREPGRY
ncbi:MAG: hypothetical protein HYZ38_03820 [Mycobacterium sp.]|nr:hypothetical protein [Mycobacterium sp.]